MIIGIPKEIKNNENRVSMTPAGVHELVKHGHVVLVQKTAGEGSGFSDEDYVAVGAELCPTIEDVYARAEMIVKVKEPIEPEYKLVRKGQLLFTYLHFASSEPLTRAMAASGAVCLAYETVRKADRSLPLLTPMSEVAGRMSVQEGMYFLERPHGGKGVLLGGVPGVKPAKVFVIGGGVVGTAAAMTAAGTGADVTIADISLSENGKCCHSLRLSVESRSYIMPPHTSARSIAGKPLSVSASSKAVFDIMRMSYRSIRHRPEVSARAENATVNNLPTGL